MRTESRIIYTAAELKMLDDGGAAFARACFKRFVKNYGCARIYYRAKGEDEENDGECIKRAGNFPG